MASLARGETRTKPTLRALTAEEARNVDHGGEPIGLTTGEWAAMWEGMERVVGPDGTGRLVNIDGFRIGGKTGTADFRAHGEEVNLAWFIGFAPVEDPQIAVAVMVEGGLLRIVSMEDQQLDRWRRTFFWSLSSNILNVRAFPVHSSERDF